jgi:hypothetical protein
VGDGVRDGDEAVLAAGLETHRVLGWRWRSQRRFSKMWPYAMYYTHNALILDVTSILK